MNEMVAEFELVSGEPVPTVAVSRRVGDLVSSYADCSRAERELGWRAERSLVEICEDS